MEESSSVASKWRLMSPEIVEIGEDSNSTALDHGVTKDVYVAVGKDDLDVVKWALDHAVSPGARLFLLHVFPPITYIPTPVGMLSRNQLSREQVRFYIEEDNNRRRNLLQKYISLCTHAKVSVDTVLLESSATTKAILQLIPILNITHLVMGAKRPPFSRWPRKAMGKGEMVKKNAPDSCEVTIINGGKKVMVMAEEEQSVPSILSERNFFDCICFSSGKSSN